jgi:leucyl-tRNA synthetase
VHEIYNLLSDHITNNRTSNKILRNEWEKIIMLLMPLTPHFAHECCENRVNEIFWPKYDRNLLEDENCKVVIQVDGRKRGIFDMPINSEEKIVIKKSKEVENVLKYLENTKIVKSIYVKNKLVNHITKK